MAVLALHWAAPPRWRNPILLAASYLFYGMWDWRFLGLLLVSTVVDYSVARMLEGDRPARVRKALLATSIAVNLGILGFFKYANFFADGFTDLAGSVGLAPGQFTLAVVLPVGISFYTFQTMSYSIDVYRRRLEPCRNIVDFATYVAFFPQLVAGPIERAHNLLPRLQRTDRSIGRAEIESGLGLILLGLVKKVVLADGVASVADKAFSDPSDLSFVAVGAGVLAFSIQIYGDFSGYTDIARGVSRMLGVELLVNFRQPYLARNITEFWRQWHISLSNWLRDYLYIPLGGNRRGRTLTIVNLMITMLLGGLWHGASWNFVVWGGLHGLYLVVHRVRRAGNVSADLPGWRDLPAIGLTFGVVSMTWIFFRAADFATAADVFRALAFQPGFTDRGDVLLVALTMIAMVGIDVATRFNLVTPALLRTRPTLAGAMVSTALLSLLLFSGGVPRPFVYFQF